MSPKESLPKKLEGLYTALFIKNVEDLKRMFPPKHENIFAHHITLSFEPNDLNNISVGKETKVKIVGRVSDGKGDALLVRLYDGQTGLAIKNKNLHITLSTSNNEKNKRIPPVYSNELIKNALENNEVEIIDPPVEIDVIEGYSVKGKDVTKDPSDI